MGMIRNWLRDNSLSLTFFALFVGSAALQSLFGHHDYNQRLSAHGQPEIGYGAYLVSGDFLDAIFVNWQAAVLQLGCLIVFAEFFRQKGASHSRKTGHGAGQNPDKDVPWWYRNSLGIAFGLLFIGSITAHIFFGTWSYNETRALTDQPPISVPQYIATSDFWFKTVQTWQAEFIGIALFIVLSIFLRQQGSAESKPVRSSNNATGDTNK